MLPREAIGQALPGDKPDNVLDPFCYAPALPMVWDIRQAAASSSAIVTNNVTPLVGDLDGDGIPEIVCWGTEHGYNLTDAAAAPWPRVRQMLIYKGNNLAATPIKINITVPQVTADPYMSAYEAAPYGLVKTSSGRGLIIVACSDYKLRAYDMTCGVSNSATQTSPTVWTSTVDYGVGNIQSAPAEIAVNIGFADFNHDGIPELYIRNKIYNAENGAWIATATGGNGNTGASYSHFSHVTRRKLSSPIAADVLGDDGHLELILGNEIYNVNIDNPDPAQRITFATRCTPPEGFHDGHAQVADFTGDGKLDILITFRDRYHRSDGVSYVHMYLWDLHAANPTAPVHAVKRSAYEAGKSFPLISDFNNDGNVDIVIQHGRPGSSGVLWGDYYFWTFKKDTKQFELLYSLLGYLNSGNLNDDILSEDSHSNAPTLFDFNQDGLYELLFTDQKRIKLFNVSGKSHKTGNDTLLIYLLKQYAYTEITIMQLPIVADVDGDGAAEIVTCGSNYLNTFKSNGNPWAPARKVWNQYMYNSVNINEDLTVPKYQFNSAAKLPGLNGIPGDYDDIQPFNNFLQQQSVITSKGIQVWSLPDASPTIEYEYYGSGDSITLDVEVLNMGSAQLRAPLNITIYTKSGGTETFRQNQTITLPIEMNQSKIKHIKIENVTALGIAPTDSVIIYVNRDNGTKEWVYQECNYVNNRVGESLMKIKNRLMDDTRTVQRFSSVEISVLSNDRFPPGFIAPPFSLIDSVILQPRNGTLVGVGSGATSRLIYINEGTDKLTTNPIDSFIYRIRMPNGRSELPATVYIYILHDEDGATVCAGQNYTARMRALPAGTTFGWYLSFPDMMYAGGGPTTCDVLTDNDLTLQVKPNTSGAGAWNNVGGFPAAPFTFHATKANEQMRWTGHINSDWNNPANWVVVRSVGESPATFLPGLCTDVTISANVNNFPELGTDTARCAHILMKDRSMLKNPHVLKYTNASVEMRMKPSEMDRFVMWSAPLKHMYSGDYHYRQNNSAFFGDIFMNFFQIQNPDHPGYAPIRNRLSATFANPNVAIPLGTAFNLKVVGNSVTRDSMLRFPRTETNYPNAINPGPVTPFARDSSGRFITDGYGQNLQFDMPVKGYEALAGGSGIVQVVNPYMAYLDIAQFLAQAPSVLFKGCYIWDGEVDSPMSTFAITTGGTDQYRIIINDGSASYAQTGLIPPLQSFFVATTTPVTTLKMSRAWTTTKPVDSYTLRSSVKSGGVLNVTLSGSNKKAHAALAYEPGASNFSSDQIDMPAITYTIEGESPLSLYTFSADLSALVINASSTFDMQPVKLGLIAHEPGEYTLSFAGLYSFGHEVTLMDADLNKSIVLGPSADEYKFTLIRPNGNKAIEVNDRFKLYFKYTGNGINFTPTEDAIASPLRVTSERGYINVSSSALPISALRVYDAHGRMVYQASNPAGAVKIPVAGGLYLVTARFGSEEKIKKIIVK